MEVRVPGVRDLLCAWPVHIACSLPTASSSEHSKRAIMACLIVSNSGEFHCGGTFSAIGSLTRREQTCMGWERQTSGV